MYPELFRIRSFEVTSFGLMVAAGALVGLWLFERELKRSGLPAEAVNGAVIGVIAGLIGAKLLWAVEHRGEEPIVALLTSRGGLSWFGGLFAALAAGLGYFRWKRWNVLPILAAATPAMPIGHLLGRIGCFLVGDDYGRPTSLPWGVAFPRGLPPTLDRVHPTQLYEGAFLALLAWMLIRWRRKGLADRTVLGRYFVIAGAFRFLLEFVRVNVRVLGPLTVAHCFALAVVALGLVILLRRPARA